MHSSLRAGVLASLQALALAVAFCAPAVAQESETVVITGSRIRVDPLEQTQPVTTLGVEDLAETGLSATADVLQRLPLASGGLNQRNNASGNLGNPPDGGGVGAGAAEIDLRYLGSRRVLVLVDGLRWVQGASASGVPGSVDLNTIPTGMIDRIEVLQEGASPIYGSDAIAGVVNIITKNRQEGLEASAQVGGYFEEGDGFTQEYKLSLGINDERTRAIVGVDYVDQESVLASDRDVSQFPSPGATSCAGGGCSSAIPNGRFRFDPPGPQGLLDLTLKAALQPGQVPVYTPANPTGPASSFRAYGGNAVDGFNFQPYNYVVTPSERVGAFALVTHEFDNSLRFLGKVTYVNRRSANQAAPLPLFLGPDAGNGNLLDTVSIDATNPFNAFGFTLGPGTLSVVTRRLLEAGPRHFEQNVDTWNATGTLQGDINWLGADWYWDVNAVWSRNSAQQTFTGNVNAQRVQQALGPLSQCAAPCVPLNVFGGPGTITPAMLGFIGFTQQDTSEQELRDYSANVTADVFNLPAGPVGIAFGFEWRDTRGFFQPDAVVAAGLSSDIPAQPARGKINVDEAYLEVEVPLLKDLSLAKELTLSLAGRTFDYSTSGRDNTVKAGLRWRPSEDVLVRASWGEGFRAPSIGELFGTASRFDQEVVDPCSNFLGLTPPGPVQPLNVRNNCIARGVPANGSYVQLNPQISVITSGNTALIPETSESWNTGVVWDPSFLHNASWTRGMTFEVNYADIELEDAIQAQNGQALLDRCAQTLDLVACNTITRTASGQVSAISNPLINIGGIKTKQVDFAVTYGVPATSIGTFDLRLNAAHLEEFTEFVPTSTGLAPVKREGTERGSPDQAYPEWKASFGVDWSLSDFGASLLTRHVSDVTEPSGAKMGSMTYWDAQFRWTPDYFNDQFSIAAGINNFTDEDPPGCISCSLNNFDPTTYDPPGRFAYVRFAIKD